MTKMTTIDTIEMYNNLSGEGTVSTPSSYRSIINSSTNNGVEAVSFPKIQCIVATKSAQASINGLWMKYAPKKGMPLDMYDAHQNMGRVN